MTKVSLVVFLLFMLNNQVLQAQSFNQHTTEIVGESISGYELSANFVATDWTATPTDYWGTTPGLIADPCTWDPNFNQPQDCMEAMVDFNSTDLTNFDIKETRAYIKLENIFNDQPSMASSAPQIFSPYVYKFHVQVRTYKSLNCTQFDVHDEFLLLSYLPDGTLAYQDVSMKTYPGAYSIQAQIIDVFDVTDEYYPNGAPNGEQPPVAYPLIGTPSSAIKTGLVYSNGLLRTSQPNSLISYLKKNWKLNVGISYQKFVKKIPGATPTQLYESSNTAWNQIQLNNISSTFSQPSNSVTIDWTPLLGEDVNPVLYELEWVYVDNYEVTDNNGAITVSEKSQQDCHYSFLNSATRISTDQSSYEIPLVFKEGYLIYRVRAIRPEISQFKESRYTAWSQTLDVGAVAGLNNSHYFKILKAHLSDDMNWNYQSSFAEEGKSKNVLSYFDGLLKNRQSLTKFSSTPNQIIVSEPKYNYEGGVGVQSLPVPVIKDPTVDNELKFQENFMLNQNSAPLSADDFDQQNSNNLSNGLHSNSLASQYYSGNNSLLSTQPNSTYLKAIPDAENFPFIETQFAPDDPSRIKIQGGAGQALQIGSLAGAETKYYYMDPEQSELNQFLGLHSGYSKFYEKVITRDPNDQMSFSITNNLGKPVMTGLMGWPSDANDDSPLVKLDKLAVASSNPTNYPWTNLLANNLPLWSGNVLKANKTYFNEVSGATGPNNYFKVNLKLPPFNACESTSSNIAKLNVTIDYKLEVIEENSTTATQVLTHSENPSNGTLNKTHVGQADGMNVGVASGETIMKFEAVYDENEIYEDVNALLGVQSDGSIDYTVLENLIAGTNSCLKEKSNILGEIGEGCSINPDAVSSDCANYEDQLIEQLSPGKVYGKYHRVGTKKIVLGDRRSIFSIVRWTNFSNNMISSITSPTTNMIIDEWDENNHAPAATLSYGQDEYVPWQLPEMSDPTKNTELNTLLTQYQSATISAIDKRNIMGEILDILSDEFIPVYAFQRYFELMPSNPSPVPFVPADELIDDFDLLKNSIPLLELHPEFCTYEKLYCDHNSSFINSFENIPSYEIAESLKLSSLAELNTADPFSSWLTSPTIGGSMSELTEIEVVDLNSPNSPQPAINVSLEVYALMMLQPQDVIWLEDLLASPLSPNISLSTLTDAELELYFKNLRAAYLGNRGKLNAEKMDFACSSSTLSKDFIQEEWEIFKEYLDTNNDPKVPPFDAGIVAAYNSSSAAATIGTTADEVDDNYLYVIMKSLQNCTSVQSNALSNLEADISHYFKKIRFSKNDRAWKGGLTPSILRNLMVLNGIDIDDLCNPYLFDYEPSPDFILENTEFCEDPKLIDDLKNTFFFEQEAVISLLNESVPTLNTGITTITQSLSLDYANSIDSRILHTLGYFDNSSTTTTSTNPVTQTVTCNVTYKYDAANNTPNFEYEFISAQTGIPNLVLEMKGTATYNDPTSLPLHAGLSQLSGAGDWFYYYEPPSPPPSYQYPWIPVATTTAQDAIGNAALNHMVNAGTNNGYFFYSTCSQDAFNAKPSIELFYYINADYMPPNTNAVQSTCLHRFEMNLDVLGFSTKNYTCLTPIEMREVYEDFQDDVISDLEIKGREHPNYTTVLQSYCNYKFRKSHHAERYEHFMTGCNLTSFDEVPNYYSYVQVHTSNASDIENLLNWCASYGSPNNSLKDLVYTWYADNANQNHLYIDFNSVFKDEKLRPFLDILSTQLGSYSNMSYEINKLESEKSTAPLTNDRVEVLVKLADLSSFQAQPNALVPNATVQYVTVKSMDFSNLNPASVTLATDFVKHTYDLPNSLGPSEKADMVYHLRNELYDKEIPYIWFSTLESHTNEDNLHVDKINYLSHAYDVNIANPQADHDDIINALKVPQLKAGTLNSYSSTGNYLSYQNPLTAQLDGLQTSNDDYLSGTLYAAQGSSTSSDGLSFLSFVFDQSKYNNVSSFLGLGSVSLCSRSPNSIFYNAADYQANNYVPMTYNASSSHDGSYAVLPRILDNNVYWFKMRMLNANNEIIDYRNVYLKIPDYFNLEMLKRFEVDPASLQVVFSEEGSRFFTVNFNSMVGDAHVSNCFQAMSFTALGKTDFDLQNVAPEVFEYVMLCDDDNVAINDFDVCFEDEIQRNKERSDQYYRQYVNKVRDNWVNAYTKHIKENLKAKVFLKKPSMKYAITLYRYDRAGNLVATVPPEGVRELSKEAIENIDDERAAVNYATYDQDVVTINSTSHATVPEYHKTTTYAYNSLNQLVTQGTPDGGETKFYYDASGKLAFSQNAKQTPNHQFSYTLYDDQNRIIETGQIDINIGSNVDQMIEDLRDFSYPPNLLSEGNKTIREMIRSYPRREVVRTFYDEELYDFTANSNGLSAQNNLRARVSAIANYHALNPSFPNDNALNNYSVAVHYSYDLSGNVKTLTYDMPQLDYINQRYKRIDYDYDLYSGKVNLVSFNRGFVDQYYQRYDYDADNRITSVETSKDGLLWDNDATYEYYPHGPLARVELGDKKLQGIDFAYTLQGWLKSINGDTPDPIKDQGGDGHGNNEMLADVYNSSLYYYEDDYKPIDETDMGGTDDRLKISSISTDRSLYNGNISAMLSAPGDFQPLVSEYQYDQLNRIKQARYKLPDYGSSSATYGDIVQDYNGNVHANSPLAGANDLYKTKFTYDFDGNIMSLKRYGVTIPGATASKSSSDLVADNAEVYLMDDLDYFYDLESAQTSATGFDYTKNNKLRNYTEQIDNTLAPSIPFSNDLQNKTYVLPETPMNSPRFEYDAIGNLVADRTNPKLLSNIFWTLYGKVDRVEYDNDEQSIFKYDPTGHRFSSSKVLPPNSTNNSTAFEAHINEYYIRDASGNIMAIYKHRQDYSFSNGFEVLVGGLTGLSNFETTLTTVVNGSADFSSELTAQINEQNSSFANAQFNAKNPGFYAAHNMPIRTTMIAQTENIINDFMDSDKQTLVDAASTRYEPALLEPLWFEQNEETKNTYISLLTAENDVTEMQAIIDALGTGATVESTEGFIEEFINAQNSYSMMEALNLLATHYNGGATSWSTTVDRMIEDENFRGTDYEEFSYLNINSFLANRLGTHGAASVLESYYDAHANGQTILDESATSLQKLNVIYNHEPINFHAAFKTESNADEVLGGSLEAISGISISSFMNAWIAADPSSLGTVQPLAQSIIEKEKYYLAEHHLYGSSRLGVKEYWPDHYNFNWEKDDPVDFFTSLTANELLSKKRPWYSDAYKSLIASDKVSPWGNANTDDVYSYRMAGQKHYELSNHLGNVMTVVSDKYVEKPINTSSTDAEANASIYAAYDYYPFGMIMPHRLQSNNVSQSAPVTKTYYQVVEVPIHDVGLSSSADINYFDASEGTTIIVEPDPYNGSLFAERVEPDGMDADVLSPMAGIEANKELTLVCDLENLTGNTIFIEIEQEVSTGSWEVLASTTVENVSEITLKTTPATDAPMRLRYRSRDGHFKVGPIMVTKRDELEMTETVVINSTDADFDEDYRFGFNGQEKDNEVKGIGNSNTAEFWQYDTRLGRRWNLDPVDQVNISNYAAFGNNPIFNIDPKGNTFWLFYANREDAVLVMVYMATIYASKNGEEAIHELHNMSNEDYSIKNGLFSSSYSAYSKTMTFPPEDGPFTLFHEIDHVKEDAHGSYYSKASSEGGAILSENYLRSVYGRKDFKTDYNFFWSDFPFGSNQENFDKYYKPTITDVNEEGESVVITGTETNFTYDNLPDTEKDRYTFDIKKVDADSKEAKTKTKDTFKIFYDYKETKNSKVEKKAVIVTIQPQ